MPQDSLGNNIPFQGNAADFVKAMRSTLNSPVKSNVNMDSISDAIQANSNQIKELGRIVDRLTQDSKKALSDNSNHFRKLVGQINDSITSKKTKRGSKDVITKLAEKGLKPGSIHVRDLRAGKHLINITNLLKKIAERVKVTDVNKGIHTEKEIRAWARAQEKKYGTSSVKSKDIEMEPSGSAREFIRSTTESTTSRIGSWFSDLLAKGFAGVAGYNLSSPISDAIKEGAVFQKIMAETYLQQEGISKALGMQSSVVQRTNLFYEKEYRTGLDINKEATTLLRLKRMGIKDQKESLNVMTRAGRIAYLMDLDAESTAEMFGEWSLHLGASNKDLGTMARSIKDTTRLTGLMGDHLSKAVQASKGMMEYMRSIGKFTADAAGNVIKLTAAAQKYGVAEQVGELQKLLGGGMVRAATGGSKMLPLFYRMVTQSGLMDKFKSGENILGDKDSMKKFAIGIQSQLDVFAKMTKEQQAAFARGMGMEVGDLELVFKAWQESTMTFEDRIKLLQKDLDDKQKIGALTNEQKNALEHQISDLKIENAIQEKQGLLQASVEINKLADEINKKAGRSVIDKVDVTNFGNLNKEQQAEILKSRKEEIDKQLKILQTPQEEANNYLREIYKDVHEIGAFLGANSNKWVSLTSGLIGDVLGGIMGGFIGSTTWKALQGGGGGLKRWFGGGKPTPGLGGGKPGGLGGMKPKGLGGMKPGGLGGAGPGGLGGTGAGAKAASGAGRFGKLFGSVPTAGKALNVLGKMAGPVAVGLGAYSGYQEAEEAGRGKLSGTVWGMLTGGAKRGSVLSEMLGIQKDSTADWEMGLLGAGAHGASIGSMFGPHGAAIGASIGMLAETAKITYDVYEEVNNISNKIKESAKNRLDVELEIANKSQQAIDAIKDPGEKLAELKARRSTVEQQVTGATKNAKVLQKDLDSMWFFERWGSSNDKLIKESQDKAVLKQKELDDLDKQISEVESKAKVSTTAPKSIESIKENRARLAKVESEAENKEHLNEVADNTEDMLDVLTKMHGTIVELLESTRQNNASPDTDVYTAGRSRPDFGRMIKNTRSGSVNSGMTYTQMS